MEDLEIRLEEQRKRIAASIPGYTGYRQREQRREADQQLRVTLARQYGAQRDRLMELQRRAANKALLSALDDMERAGQKLQLFVDRLRTASYGYAGWFDAVQIREPELEQLYAFDQTLARGITQVSADIDGVAEAVNAGAQIEEAIDRLVATVNELHHRFDQRRDLLAEGKKVPPSELQDALVMPEPAPSPAFLALADLKVDDAITYDTVDYLVTARITYDAQDRRWHAYRIEDTGTGRWLQVGLTGEEVGLFDVFDYTVTMPPVESLNVAGESFNQIEHALAKVSIVGPGGRREGTAEYWMYASDKKNYLWIEQWGEDTRVHRGHSIDPELIQVWPRN